MSSVHTLNCCNIQNMKTQQSCSLKIKVVEAEKKGITVKNSFCNNLENCIGEEKDKSSLDTKRKLCPGIITSIPEKKKCPNYLVSPIRHYANYALKCKHSNEEGKTENKN